MRSVNHARPRVVQAVRGRRKVRKDSPRERRMAARMRAALTPGELAILFSRLSMGGSEFHAMMRRVVLRALVRRMGDAVEIAPGVQVTHPETFEIGSGVFIGAQAVLQGRFDGRCVIGDHAWIGPQSYFDARNLVIGEYVGWGPGAKVLGSEHTGAPVDRPVIQTDLVIKPVRVRPWADIGTGAILLPGVTVGKGAIIGAGAVVNRNVPAFTVWAGVPARFVRRREGAVAKGKAAARKRRK